MAASEHEKAIKDYLIGQGVSEVRAAPPTRHHQTGVFIISTGGPSPESFFGQDGVFKQVALQVMVIADANDPASGHAKAQTIYDHLTNAKPTNYMVVGPRQSAPIFLGIDTEDRMRWSINILAKIVE